MVESDEDSEKRTPWWNQDVKEAIRAKKNSFNALLQLAEQVVIGFAVLIP